jgi:valyl-tRNA synthetase
MWYDDVTSRKAHALVARSTASLEAYNIGDAGTAVYEFFWDEFADWCAASRHLPPRDAPHDTHTRGRACHEVFRDEFAGGCARAYGDGRRGGARAE